jgi:hypothetical protein
VPLQEALERYAGRVFEGARAAVEASRLPIPPFDLQQVIVSAEVSPTANPAGELAARLGSLATRVVDGGEAGRVAGASIGGWIDKNILGVDAARQAMEAVERAARNVASLLEGEAGKYLNRVEALLAEADRYYEQWVRTSSRLSVAQETEGRYRELLTWCTGFLEGVQGIEGEFRP